jgi:hypothetical protein
MKVTYLFLTVIAIPVSLIAQSTNACNCLHPFPYRATLSQTVDRHRYKHIVSDRVVTNFYDALKRDYLKP